MMLSLRNVRHCLCLLLFVAASASASARIAEVDAVMCDAMRNTDVLHKNAPVSCAQLRIVRFDYLNLDGQLRKDGEIMVMAAVAEQVQAIFATLLQRKFALAGARLMNHYHGDDAAAMRDNNTSAFNDRVITKGSATSLHAYGLAIDINPVQNPFLQLARDGTAVFSPASGSNYANRVAIRPGKPIRKGMAEEVVEVFAQHGFLIWGGNWDAPIDYQHFQVSRALAERMAALPVAQAREIFSAYVERYRACIKNAADSKATVVAASCAAAG